MSGQQAEDEPSEVLSLFSPYSHGLFMLTVTIVASFGATVATLIGRDRVTYHDLIVWSFFSFVCFMLMSDPPRFRVRALLESLFGTIVSVLCMFIFATQHFEQVIFP